VGARNWVEWGCRTGPPGNIGWRNWFIGIDSWAPYKLKKFGLSTLYYMLIPERRLLLHMMQFEVQKPLYIYIKYREGPIPWPLWTKCVEPRGNIHKFEMNHLKMLLKVLSKEKRCWMKVVSINYRRSVGGWWINLGNLRDTSTLYCYCITITADHSNNVIHFCGWSKRNIKLSQILPSFVKASKIHHRCFSKVYYTKNLTQPHLCHLWIQLWYSKWQKQVLLRGSFRALTGWGL
jgi:hypothetical protein